MKGYNLLTLVWKKKKFGYLFYILMIKKNYVWTEYKKLMNKNRIYLYDDQYILFEISIHWDIIRTNVGKYPNFGLLPIDFGWKIVQSNPKRLL